jgi:hypothetical protein
MSVFTDAFKLLNGEANAFALLPVINQGYVYWQTTDPSLIQTAIVVGSLAISSVAFNVLTHSDFERYNSGDETMSTGSALSLILIAVFWIIALGYGLIQLYPKLASDKLWPVLLTAVSLLLVCLLVTHVILGELLSVYDSG